MFEGSKDGAGAITNLSALGQVGPNRFPVQNYNNRGMGEYQNGALYGSPDGNLYPMWMQGIPTTSSCISCVTPDGTNWNFIPMTTQVIP
ncbi:MAG: hypothetical protein EXR72_26415 [Myxococcales bacterium]|nr:hypothetical protein [Myxococcales bacterium]